MPVKSRDETYRNALLRHGAEPGVDEEDVSGLGALPPAPLDELAQGRGIGCFAHCSQCTAESEKHARLRGLVFYLVCARTTGAELSSGCSNSERQKWNREFPVVLLSAVRLFLFLITPWKLPKTTRYALRRPPRASLDR